MPHEWRFGGRSAASPRRWAAADGGLPAAAADAFIDRASIDWRSLRTRARTAADRAFVDNLRRLDRLRRPHAAAVAVERRSARLAVFARAVATLAAIQTVVCLSAAALFTVGGRGLHRPSTVFLALSFAVACILLAAASRRDRRALFLLAFFACGASAFARGSLTAFQHALPSGLELALRDIVPEALAPAALWQFAADFPRVRRFARFDVVARRVASWMWIAGSAMFALNFAADHSDGTGGWLSLLQRNHPSNAFWFVFALAIAPAVGAIQLRARRAPPDERRKAARLAFAIAAGTAPFLCCAIARLTVPTFNQWMSTRHSTMHVVVDAVIVAALGAMPVASAVAAVFDRPFERQQSVPHRWRSGAATLTLLALSSSPAAALGVALYEWRGLALADVVVMPRFWLLAVVAAAGAAMIRARGAIVDVIVNKGTRRTDGRERLSAALDRARLARGAREIAAVLARELRDGMRAAAVRILESADVAGGAAFADPFGQASSLDSSAAIVAMLRQTAAPIDFSDPAIASLLPAVDRDWLAVNNVALAVALTRRDGELAAIVACAPRHGAEPFDARDRWFLMTMIRAVAPAWEAEAAPVGEDDGAAPLHASDRPDDLAFECSRCGLASATSALTCGCGAPATLAALPPVVAGGFVVERRLGAGGMGVVYLARDGVLDRAVALKTLPALRDGAVARLRGEARAMAALNHESLATLYGMAFWRRTPVLIVEYFPGGTLADRIARRPLAPADALVLGLRLARALDYMHASGVLHRDLKPSNIAYTAAGMPKLLDFGLAALISPARRARHPYAERPAGTHGYLPPEAYRGAAADAALDRWALAVVLFEAIAGRNSFASIDRRQALSIDLAPFSVVPDRLLLPLRAFFERALAGDAGRRFQTTPELVAALEAMVARLDIRSG